jgi:hypothetical protein
MNSVHGAFSLAKGECRFGLWMFRGSSKRGWQRNRAELGFAFAEGVITALRGWFAQNATASAARFDLNEQNCWLKDRK